MDDAQSTPKIKENSTQPPTTDTKIGAVTSSLLVDNVVASPSPSMFAAEAAAAVAAAVASSMESKKLFSVQFRRPRTSSEPGPHPPSLSAQHIHPRSSSESKTSGHRTRRASSLLKDVFKDEKGRQPSPTDKSATIPPHQQQQQQGLDSRPSLSSSPPATAATPAHVTNEAEDQRRNRHQRSRRDRHNLRFLNVPSTSTSDLEKQRQQLQDKSSTTPITIPLSSSLSIPSSSSSAPGSLQQPAIMKRARAKTMPKLPPELMEKMKEAQVKESTATATTTTIADGLGGEDDSRADRDATSLPPKDDGSLPAEADPASSWAAAAPRKIVDVQPTPSPSSPSPFPSPSSPAPSPRDDNSNKKTPPSSSMQRSLSARLISFKDRVARPSSPLSHSSPSSPSLGVTNISENYESVDKVWLRQILKHANDRAIATSILCSALRSPTHPYGIVVAHYAATTNTAIANIIERATSIDDTEIVQQDSGGEDDDSSSSDDDDFYTPPPIPTSLQSQYLSEALSNIVADLNTFADSVSETIVMHYEPLRQISRPMEVCKAAIFDAILPSIYTDLILLYNMRFKIMDQRYNDKIASMSTLTPGHLAIRPKLWLIHMPDIPNPGMVAPVIAPSSPSLSSKSGFFSIGSRRTSVSPVSPPPAKISLPVPPYQPAIEIFKQLAISKNPTRRSQILKHCMDGLQKCVHDHWRGVHSPDDLVIGADDLLPIFTFIVIKSGTKNMHSEMEFHKDFMSEMDASGMEGYLMTTLETSLLLIHELQQDELRKNASSLVDVLMGATPVSS
eukprot:TRINITY_DN2574_c0_g1_i3.p1 TRINITY_DN2574_c0_g1~~TRINITY_DN2574_c0_g1_i3.p1  ORF type:complete len:788 (-),score=193.88 TRINITY_DN2574_c0_g1_i3:18-2381(-)